MDRVQEILHRYATVSVGYASRAKVLAADYGMTPKQLREHIVDNGQPLIGCDVNAYRKQHMTEEQRADFNRMISPARRKFWENISQEDYEWRQRLFSRQMTETTRRLKADEDLYHHWRQTQRASLLHKYQTTDLPQRIAEGVRNYYATLPYEERRELARRRAKASLYGVGTTVDGKELWFDSSWELALYDKLVSWSESFDYTNEVDTSIRLTCGLKKIWEPDFVLPQHGMILEVKGHPKAFEKWNTYDMPNIMMNDIGYDVYLVPFSAATYGSFDELMADSKLVIAKQQHCHTDGVQRNENAGKLAAWPTGNSGRRIT